MWERQREDLELESMNIEIISDVIRLDTLSQHMLNYNYSLDWKKQIHLKF